MMCLKNVSMIFVLWETRGQGSRWREWSTIPRAGPAQIITTVKVTRVGIRSKPVSWFFMVCIPHKTPNVNAICNPMHKMSLQSRTGNWRYKQFLIIITLIEMMETTIYGRIMMIYAFHLCCSAFHWFNHWIIGSWDF